MHRIYIIKYDHESTKIDYWKKYLTPSEHFTSQSFITEELTDKFIITRSILRLILSEHTSFHPTEIEFVYNQYNKPYLKNHNVFFNISHANNILVIGISDYEIGVDIEYIDHNTLDDDLAKAAFSNQEYNYHKTLEQNKKIIFFYNIWSSKESMIKLIGEGLNYPIDSIDLSDQITKTHYNILNIKIREKNIHTQKINIAKDYVLFISAYHSLKAEITYFKNGIP